MSIDHSHKIVIPIMTPFHEDETVNYEALAKYVRYLLDNGADGIYAGGSSAECFLLSDEERKKALETVIKAADGAFVIANIGTIGSRTAEDFAKHAQKVGADVISSVPPFYFGYSFNEIVTYYRGLADAVDIPVMIYNIPGTTTRFTAGQFDELLQDDRIRYLKYTDTDYYTMEQIISHSDVFVYSGKDENFLSALSAGAHGGIGTSFNYMFKKFEEIQSLYTQNKMAEALNVQHGVNEIIRTVCDCSFMDATKHAITLTSGIPFGHARRPFSQITEEGKVRVQNVLTKFGVL